MKNEFFINESFTKALNDYLASENNPDSILFNSFYVVVIRVLSLIYGKTDLFNPYYLQNKLALINNLSKFGMSDSRVMMFFKELDDFYKIDLENNNKNIKEKNPYFNEVLKYLVDMFLLKKENGEVSFQEEADFLDLIYTSHTKNPYRISYSYYMSEDMNFIEKYYYTRVNGLEVTTNLELDKRISGSINLEALNLMGISLSKLKNMSDEEIRKAKDESYNYFMVDADNPNRDEELKSSIDFYKNYGRRVTTGNGYVDFLLLISVIVTSISVILILVFNII